jgi:hypothetical protein
VKIVATYPYVDELGEPLFEVVRFEPKDFRQRRRNGAGWAWNLDGVRRVLYRLPDVLAAVATRIRVFIVEGEKDVAALVALGACGTTCPGGANKWREEYTETLRGARVVIIGDHDEAGRKHAHHIAAELHVVAAEVRVIELVKHWPACPHKGDVSDWLQRGGGSKEKLREIVNETPVWEPKGAEPGFQPAYVSGLRVLTGAELLSLDLPPRVLLLSPWLPEKGLALIHAERGIGKTWVAMNAAHALNTAGEFLGWRARRPIRVVYLDGEMPTAVLQQRYATIVAAAPNSSNDDDLFSLVAADYQRDGLPDLADPTAQGFYDDVIRDAEVIVVDNLSTICRSVRENACGSVPPVAASSSCITPASPAASAARLEKRTCSTP